MPSFPSFFGSGLDEVASAAKGALAVPPFVPVEGGRPRSDWGSLPSTASPPR